jgi:hypothetical protein
MQTTPLIIQKGKLAQVFQSDVSDEILSDVTLENIHHKINHHTEYKKE